MPKLNEMFPSNYLKASDFTEDGQVVTIREVVAERIGQGRDAEDKYIIHFEELDKGLVLNKTNSNTIAKLYGDDTDDWEGKKITLYATETEFKGEMTECIRVKSRIPKPASPAKPVKNGKETAAAAKPGKPQRSEDNDGDFDDDTAPY